MAAVKSRFQAFKEWAIREFEPTTKLPWRPLTVTLHEDIVEFLHGFMIGAITGFLVGFVLITLVF